MSQSCFNTNCLCWLPGFYCRFVPAWGAGNDLLRQVKHVSVNVLLLRCTLGMHMTVSLGE
jgi:hypothetical protein